MGWVLLLCACRVVAPSATRGDCSSNRPPDRTCTVDSECAVVVTNHDCCGTPAAKGVNLEDRQRYEAQERLCPMVQRVCKCQAGDTVFDDGSRAPFLLAADHRRGLAARCASGLCTTSFLP